MNKKILYFAIAVFVACFLVLAAGCKADGEVVGQSYSFQEAYDGGLLTKQDLESIAAYHNGGTEYPQPLDEGITRKIKEIAAKELREEQSEPEAKAEGFEICAYYGAYNGLYAVRISNVYEMHPADEPNYSIKIGGVDFHIGSYDRLCVFKVG